MNINELTPEQNRVRDLLIAKASKKLVYYYSDLVRDAGLHLDMNIPADRGKIGNILGAISTYEHNQGRPMLSSVVVSKSFEQGDGFFKLAEELGYGDWKTLKNEKIFEMDMMNKTHDYWHSQSK